MSQRVNIAVDLKESQVEYLEGVLKQYAIPDIPKAIRVLVEYAIHEEDRRDEIFAVLRCRDCS
jgi:hypothetical protein